MTYSAEHLYSLLPAIYRVRDAELGYPLQALVAVVAAQAGVMENDLAQLYDNWFIETCDDWVVPYVGDLLDAGQLVSVSAKTFSQRARVANTIGYRRRKGTAVMLQQLAHDVTGWPARAVENFELLTTTQNLNHLRLNSLATPDLRDAETLQLLGGPFERTTHNAGIRLIRLGRGRYNIPDISIFLWRLVPYTLIESEPVLAPDGPGLYRFSQLGLDQAIITRPLGEEELSWPLSESQAPGPIRSWAFVDDLQGYQQQFAALQPAERPADSLYYGPDVSIAIVRDGAPVPPLAVVPADLSAWKRPDPGQVAVDVCLGRFAFNDQEVPAAVRVNYTYAFSGDIGGGPYDRSASTAPLDEWGISWQIGVSRVVPPAAHEVVATLDEAVTAWNAQPDGTRGLIVVMDNSSYQAPAAAIQVGAGSKLAVIAADWTLPDGAAQRVVGQFTADRLRPHIAGDLVVAGTAAEESPDYGTLVIDGLLVSGGLLVNPGNLGRLEVAHSTVVPGQGSLTVQADAAPQSANGHLVVVLRQSICGPLRLPANAGDTETVPDLILTDSIIQGSAGETGGQVAVTAPGTRVSFDACTVFGATDVRHVGATNSLFSGIVTAKQHQDGCVRYSFVPSGSRTSRRYRCQPELAISVQADDEERSTNAARDPARLAQIEAEVTAWLVPSFTALVYGDPAYAQLSSICPGEIKTGADDGSEMGAFSRLRQPQREANLRASLDEYLRFGLEAGVFYVT